MPVYIDQIGREILIHNLPTRIISLVPSQTELLYTLGLEEEVIGITKFCIHPAQWHQTKTKVGGTKNVNLALIKELQPDFIIANKEENNQEQIEELASLFPVWVSDVDSLGKALQMINTIGQIVALQERAFGLIQKVTGEFEKLTAYTKGTTLKALYLIWREPYMAAGGDTFISDMMQRAGFENLLGNRHRYPRVTIEDIQDLQPEVVLLSSEPYPFTQQHNEEITRVLPYQRIYLVDGEAFSWYGSHLQYVPEYFIQLQKLIATQ